MRAPRLAFPLAAALAVSAASAQELARPAELPGPASLGDVLERARAYLDDYEQRFGGVIALERYEQVESRGIQFVRRRELLSDLLMARVPGKAWVAYRDVSEVDGKPVRDRQRRLERLLREAPKGGDAVARRYADESARYNVGSVDRNLNVPTVALVLLDRAHADGVTVTRSEDEVVDGRLVAALRVRERRAGLLVRTRRGAAAESAATFWIAPDTGAIRRSELTVSVPLIRASVRVVYREITGLTMLLPVEMREEYEDSRNARLGAPHLIKGVATYEKFVRPEVTMQEWLKPGQ